jgi:hypothetical protein
MLFTAFAYFKKVEQAFIYRLLEGVGTFYPVLAMMAQDYRTVLSTSVPSESVFSITVTGTEGTRAQQARVVQWNEVVRL